MRLLLASILTSLALSSMGQSPQVPMDIYSTCRVERQLTDSPAALHPEVKPLSMWDVKALGADLSFMQGNKTNDETNAAYLLLSPIINGTGFYEIGSKNQTALESYIGARLLSGFKDKIKLSADLLAGYNEPVSNMKALTDSVFVVPGYSYANKHGNGYGFNQSTIQLAWRPSKLVEISAGRGKHFIGEGYRSLFLSDFAPNYNYLKTQVNVWRIKYTIPYSQMRSAQGSTAKFYPLQNKYSSTHHLSLNVTKWWSVGAFESVVWQSEDSLRKRQFDINYVNPIIFFRPVEYSIGSSDNYVMGFTSTIRPAKGLTLYSQIFLDEFLVKEFLAPVFAKIHPDSNIGLQSWVNKQAFQFGIKYHEPFGWKNASTLAEVNIVRPYTYSHGNSNQNYTHMNQPLGYAMGANLIEWISMTMWQPSDRWNTSITTTYLRKGYSNSGFNAGENPGLSSTALLNAKRQYGYHLLQGTIHDVANVRLEVGYTLVKQWNMRVESSIQYRSLRTTAQTTSNVFFGLGLRTALWNDYRNL